MKYLIVGRAKSGTTYLTRKMHEAGIKMWKNPESHFEETVLLKALRSIIENVLGEDRWYHNKFFDSKTGDLVCDVLRSTYLQELDGVKNPRLLLFLPYIKHTFPEMKIIICKRELNSWLRSNRKYKRSGAAWERVLKKHYYFTEEIISFHEDFPDVFIFDYDTGESPEHQKAFCDFIETPIDFSDFKTVTYDKRTDIA